MRRKVSIVRGRITDGKFEAYEDTRKLVAFNEAKNLESMAREDLSDYIASLGGKSHMLRDHMVSHAELYGKRGGLKEVHFVTHGRDLSEEDFQKFIQPYGYISAYHR